MSRDRARPVTRLAGLDLAGPVVTAGLAVLGVLAVLAGLAGCSGGSGADPSPAGVATTVASGTARGTATESTQQSSTTTSTSTTTTAPGPTTLPEGPSDTTIPHGNGVGPTMVDGTAVPAPVLTSAQQIYQAAISHDYATLRLVIANGGERRFRAGFVGEGNAVDAWKKAVVDLQADPLARLARLLETTPGTNNRGEVIYPYLAVKPPSTWDDTDRSAASLLGFGEDEIAQMQLKDRYLDLRVSFSPTGVWLGYALGN